MQRSAWQVEAGDEVEAEILFADSAQNVNPVKAQAEESEVQIKSGTRCRNCLRAKDAAIVQRYFLEMSE